MIDKPQKVTYPDSKHYQYITYQMHITYHYILIEK